MGRPYQSTRQAGGSVSSAGSRRALERNTFSPLSQDWNLATKTCIEARLKLTAFPPKNAATCERCALCSAAARIVLNRSSTWKDGTVQFTAAAYAQLCSVPTTGYFPISVWLWELPELRPSHGSCCSRESQAFLPAPRPWQPENMSRYNHNGNSMNNRLRSSGRNWKWL